MGVIVFLAGLLSCVFGALTIFIMTTTDMGLYGKGPWIVGSACLIAGCALMVLGVVL